MEPRRNFPNGRRCTIPLPPPRHNSFESHTKDQHPRSRDAANFTAWMDRQSEMITTAYGEPWQPRLPARSALSTNQSNGDGETEAEKKDPAMQSHATQGRDEIFRFTTLMNTESESSNSASRRPRWGSQAYTKPTVSAHNNHSRGMNELNKSDSMATSAEEIPIDLLPGAPKATEILSEEELQHDQTWQTDGQGYLTEQFAELGLTSSNLYVEELSMNLRRAAMADSRVRTDNSAHSSKHCSSRSTTPSGAQPESSSWSK
ncbi:hypothetical protein F5B22DRAFT_368590 [Xylaria bambusicola]|uniref:uncharacterized protein n=1 Tax=Xylaria bambusicola TaxID=326684 RepID=UPI002008D765|nr:uncharacterized protein F5B22DRAFT_368590 [Xylaria bambusicola]KAI0509251.1 hypothetical protein F5B22DRAFT_368590 [Xylaria bambusicola]